MRGLVPVSENTSKSPVSTPRLISLSVLPLLVFTTGPATVADALRGSTCHGNDSFSLPEVSVM